MENREQLILAEIKSLMSSVRSQLELLDAKMAELQQAVEPEAIDVVPIDLDINLDEPLVTEMAVGPESVEQQVIMVEDDDLPFDDLPESEQSFPESVAVPDEEGAVAETEAAETVDGAALEVEAEAETTVEEEEALLVSEAEPVKVSVVPNVEVPKAVIDVMTDKYAWRSDMPGTAVKDIRSAISLNDRIIFINYLFNEDPIQFQEALNRINQMTSLDEVVEYAVSEHPEWDLASDVIYRFMMAVRRRIR